MTIQNVTITSLEPQQYLLGFTSTVGPPISIYLDGVLYESLVSAPPGGEYLVDVYTAGAPQIDIVEGTTAPEDAYPSRITLGWYRVEDAETYRIDEYDTDATEWVTRDRIAAGATWWYSWTSRILEDVTEHQWRVVPEGALQTSGVVTTLDALMVRHPDPPDASYEYDAETGDVTVSIG